MKYEVPKHVLESSNVANARKWKAAKRKQLRWVKKAFLDLRLGCAYFPCGPYPINEAEQIIDTLQKSLSKKNWG